MHADTRYHDEYQYLIDNEFLVWTNPTGAEPVPSKFDQILNRANSLIVRIRFDLRRSE